MPIGRNLRMQLRLAKHLKKGSFLLPYFIILWCPMISDFSLRRLVTCIFCLFSFCVFLIIHIKCGGLIPDTHWKIKPRCFLTPPTKLSRSVNDIYELRLFTGTFLKQMCEICKDKQRNGGRGFNIYDIIHPKCVFFLIINLNRPVGSKTYWN